MAQQQGVGLVVVSHSGDLADAAIALASQMLNDSPVRITAAAGLDDGTFGTDAVRIKEAIERVDGPAGVVVLMDLGSAVLSAEIALELLDDPSAHDRVVLSPAPIVEGLVAAVVAAAGGGSRDAVAEEARDGILGKLAHLGAAPPTDEPDAAPPSSTDVTAVFTVTNPHGLHARPAARLVSEVRGLDATVELWNHSTGVGPVPAGSLSRVATLGALRDHQVEVRASGPQAQQAVDRLLDLAARRFDEPGQAGEAPTDCTQLPDRRSAAGPLPAAPGIAVGPVRRLVTAPAEIDVAAETEIKAPDAEWQRVVAAVAGVRTRIEELRAATARDVGEEEAGIFDAHLALLDDTEMLGDVRTQVDTGVGAARAWGTCLTEVEQRWAGLADPYLQERAADVRALGDQVLATLTGNTVRRVSGPGVLVAPDLTPADTAGLDLDMVQGVVLAHGSASSHAAILARARGLPLVVAAGADVLTVADGTPIALDGGTGELHIDPSPGVCEEFRERAREQAGRRADDLATATQPAQSRDGVRFDVLANLGSVAEARAALAAGADGAGLVRTEFLFLGRDTAPGLAEQEREYAAIAEAMGGRRITLRTLDVGGDKPLPYLPLPAEQNPFLGLRGLRLGLDRRDLLREQLVAVCRTATRSPVDVMFPMVSTLEELLEARRILADAAGPDGQPAGLRVGIMVEVPATALKIQTFLPHLDFVSIGTNDLTQYTLAAERGNAAVASLSDALDPGVLQLIDHVCRAAQGRVHVTVCGEAAADELAIPVLVGLGVSALSVVPPAVPRVKAAVRDLDVGQCRSLARQARTLAGAQDVRALVRSMAPATPA